MLRVEGASAMACDCCPIHSGLRMRHPARGLASMRMQWLLVPFFDTRLSGAEIQKLYADYRGDAYFEARHRHEFWYTRKVNDGIGSDDVKIAARKRSLAEILGDRARSFATVLDYGGDRGQVIADGWGAE